MIKRFLNTRTNTVVIFFILALFIITCPTAILAQTETQYQYLSGHDKDDAIDWDFFCTGGAKSGKWTTIKVPSQWEQQGFGNYDYGNVGGNKKNKKTVGKHDEQGKYKRTFTIDPSWQNKTIKIVFEGVMTDTTVLINSKQAGETHQGGFYRFSYDITDLITSGENLLEVNVRKVSENKSVEIAERKADYWVFGGIFRPVYLQALPKAYIDWNSVDAKANGSFVIDTYLNHGGEVDNVTAKISSLDGTQLGGTLKTSIKTGDKKVRLSGRFTGHKTWTAESPNLYQVQLNLNRGNKVIHTITKRFGFRTFVVKPGVGLFLNGKRIRLKGVNRHSFWPDSGRCLNRKICYDDVRLIKEMNMNAVRMSHYPPDVAFLEACDELGLYVLDELAGWQKPSYDTKTARRLVGQLVKRDQMHPSIIFWDNANEGGWNTEVDGDFEIYDIQKRKVLHPWAKFSEIDTNHYESYPKTQKILSKGMLFLSTEFLHGLYDGGHGAGLDDFWRILTESDLGAGGFLWCLVDEGIVRTDQNGKIDTAGNRAPDGIVGPYRQKEASFYTIKEIWSPVQITTKELGTDFNGKLNIKNTYDFRNLNSCTFKWELITFTNNSHAPSATKVSRKGVVAGPSITPGNSGILNLQLPGNWQNEDCLYVTAINAEGEKLFTWSWPITKSKTHLARLIGKRKTSPLHVSKDDKTITVTTGTFTARFDRNSGSLQGLSLNDQPISLANGPRIVHAQKEYLGTIAPPKVNVITKIDSVKIEVLHPTGGLAKLLWTVHATGYLEMQCSYICDNAPYDFHGITFDYPEKFVKAKRWLGDGPQRVWKNRMKGTKFGIFGNDYNDTSPGATWTYPAFKGYFSNINWLQLETTQGALTFATDQPNLFARVCDTSSAISYKHTEVTTFTGDISFLHGICAIGTKFKDRLELGPQSQQIEASGEYNISLFFFADVPNK